MAAVSVKRSIKRRCKPCIMRVRGPNNCHVKSCAIGSNFVALRFGNHGTKEILRVVGSKVWPVSNFPQYLLTSCNRVCKRTDHVASNNVASFSAGLKSRCRGCGQKRGLFAKLKGQSLETIYFKWGVCVIEVGVVQNCNGAQHWAYSLLQKVVMYRYCLLIKRYKWSPCNF